MSHRGNTTTNVLLFLILLVLLVPFLTVVVPIAGLVLLFSETAQHVAACVILVAIFAILFFAVGPQPPKHGDDSDVPVSIDDLRKKRETKEGSHDRTVVALVIVVAILFAISLGQTMWKAAFDATESVRNPVYDPVVASECVNKNLSLQGKERDAAVEKCMLQTR